MDFYTFWFEDSLMSQLPTQATTPSNDVILARLDERTKAISDSVSDMKRSIETVRADVERGQLATKKEIEEFRAEVDAKLDGHDGKYVTKDEFWAVRTVVFGAVALVLVSVVGALIALVIKAQVTAP